MAQTLKAGLSGKRPLLHLKSHFLMGLLNDGDQSFRALVQLLSTVETAGKELRRLLRKELGNTTRSADFWDEWNNLVSDKVERTPTVLCGVPIRAELGRSIREFSHLQHKALDAIAQFRFHPVVDFDISCQQWMQYDSRQVDDPKSGNALQELLALVSGGKLALIKQCLNCHEWFLARWQKQNCCSTLCRKQHRAKDPDFKKKRREYMKNYRDTGGRN